MEADSRKWTTTPHNHFLTCMISPSGIRGNRKEEIKFFYHMQCNFLLLFRLHQRTLVEDGWIRLNPKELEEKMVRELSSEEVWCKQSMAIHFCSNHNYPLQSPQMWLEHQLLFFSLIILYSCNFLLSYCLYQRYLSQKYFIFVNCNCFD